MAGFIIPFYFTLNPVLLLNVVPASPLSLALAILAACVGTVALSMALQGWALRGAGWLARALLAAAALVVMSPGPLPLAVATALLAGVVVQQKLSHSAGPKPAPAVGKTP